MVGDQVVELDFLCAKIEEDDVEHVVQTLHRERTIDVSVVKTSTFGKTVRKTYLTQTMRCPFRPHSCLQDQLLYEAAITKSLSRVDGVLPVLAWSHCSPSWFPQYNTLELRSLYFPYIEGNYSPKEPKDIQCYMKQLLQVLDALHLREIVHCNIKRENVLYSDGKLTLIDFESAVNEHELVDMGSSDVDEMEVCYRSNPYHSAKCWSPSRGVANMARRSCTDIGEMSMVLASSWQSCCLEWTSARDFLIMMNAGGATEFFCVKDSVRPWRVTEGICKMHWMVCASMAISRAPSFTSSLAFQCCISTLIYSNS